MFFKTLLFILLMYLLVKFIGRLFLPNGSPKGTSSASFFYQTVKRMREQQNEQERQQSQRRNVKERLDEIEEAEYEDITEPKPEEKEQDKPA